MDILGAALLLIVLGAGGFGLFWFLRSLDEVRGEVSRLGQTFQSELLQISRQMNEQLNHNTSAVRDYTRVLGEFQHRLGQLQESTQAMIHIGRDISSLQDILRAPKLRGILGELFLEELLRQILPQDRFVLQYGFRSGERVDAVILLGQGMVPVDAKFPLESFKRVLQETTEENRLPRRQFIQDVKKHIDHIASKYILPEEGTFDFALMYIPAENVYYETIVRQEGTSDGPSLSEYALARKVIPTSPNSFYAYLQAIVLGLRGLRIENSAREILNGLAQLSNEFRKFYEDFDKLGTHLTNSKTVYDKALKRLDRFQDQLQSIESQETTPILPGNAAPS